MSNRTTRQKRLQVIKTLMSLGISEVDAGNLRRISLRLHSWFEKECGINNGCIERDEQTNKPYWLNSISMRRTPIKDDEALAMKRLKRIMAHYPNLRYYIQTDPRGCSLYLLRPGDVPEGQDDGAYYSRGIGIY